MFRKVSGDYDLITMLRGDNLSLIRPERWRSKLGTAQKDN